MERPQETLGVRWICTLIHTGTYCDMNDANGYYRLTGKKSRHVNAPGECCELIYKNSVGRFLFEVNGYFVIN